MNISAVGHGFTSIVRTSTRGLLLPGLLLTATSIWAQANLGPVTVGAGLRTSFVSTQPSNGPSTQGFNLNNLRLYVNGPITSNIKFMFNTEYDSAPGASSGTVKVLDAAARFELHPMFNIWAGRFLPPSDRANLYGPFYAHNFNVYQDGVQDGYPMIFQGRDNGIVYWGDFAKKIKVSVGAFDGKSVTGKSQVISAARVQVDFWDQEAGYYLNGNYYGQKNLLAIGGAMQAQGGNTASSVDFLLDRKLPNGGVVTIESEYTNYNRLGGYNASYAKSEGAYGLGSYLFPQHIGSGQFEILGKYAYANFTHGLNPDFHQKTTEFNFTYVLREFNARIVTFVKDTRFDKQNPNFWTAGLGFQIQM